VAHHEEARSSTASQPRHATLFLGVLKTNKVLNYSDPEQLAMATTLRNCEVPFKVIGEWLIVAAAPRRVLSRFITTVASAN